MMMDASGRETLAARTVTMCGWRFAVITVTSRLMASTTSPLIFLGSKTFTATVEPLHVALKTVENPPRPIFIARSNLSVFTWLTLVQRASM